MGVKLEHHWGKVLVFQNSILRGTLDPKKEEIVGGLIQLHNEKVQKLYSLPYS
jgi:hypothetical protein